MRGHFEFMTPCPSLIQQEERERDPSFFQEVRLGQKSQFFFLSLFWLKTPKNNKTVKKLKKKFGLKLACRTLFKNFLSCLYYMTAKKL